MSVPVNRIGGTRAPGFIGAGLAALRVRQEQGEPNVLAVFFSASLAGVAVVALWRFQHRLGPSFVALFAKEGALENLTCILEFLGAVFCATAVWRFSRAALRRRGRSDVATSVAAVPSGPVRWMFGALALALFLVGMEEINWGQTLFGFKTPEVWKEINHQQQTSLHNLLDRDALEGSARALGLLLTLGTIVLVIVRLRWPDSIPGQISPHPALVPLSLCVAYASVKQHSEVVELLVAIFFAFYTYRLWSLARARRYPAREWGVRAPGSRARQSRSKCSPSGPEDRAARARGTDTG
jgi:hypothetical protein